MLVVSELATNAVLHAHTAYEVHLILSDDSLTIEVRDGSVLAPAMRRYGTDATTGRGMEPRRDPGAMEGPRCLHRPPDQPAAHDGSAADGTTAHDGAPDHPAAPALPRSIPLQAIIANRGGLSDFTCKDA